MTSPASRNRIGRTIAGLSLEEKIGQLLTVAFFDLGDDALPGVLEAVARHHLGGVFHLCAAPERLAAAVARIQRVARVPVLVSADYEVGPGWSVPGGLLTPRPMSRGAAVDSNREYALGRAIAAQGRAMGANMTFSPVVDLNTHPQNPDINIRAYGEDAAAVGRLAVPHVRGLQDHGLLACAKHFPGNGSTDMDQHINAAIIPLSAEAMRATCLEAYRRVFRAGVSAVMVGHFEVPAFTTEINPVNGRPVPASASREILTDLLRGELGFRGLAISDAMNMGGVSTHYGRGEAAVRSIRAGMDMLLVFHPGSYQIEYDALLAAARTGELPLERIDEAVGRILETKIRAGLIGRPRFRPSPAKLRREFAPGRHDRMLREISAEGLTLLRNRGDVLPLRDLRGKRIAVASSFNPDAETLRVQGQAQQIMRDRTPELLRARGAVVEEIELPLHAGYDVFGRLATNAPRYDAILLNFFIIPTWAIGTLIPNKTTLRLFMYGLLTNGCPVVITAFGDPFVMHHFPAAPVVLCAYDESPPTQEAVVRAWCGEAPVTGRSPVTLPGVYRRGDGLDLPVKRRSAGRRGGAAGSPA